MSTELDGDAANATGTMLLQNLNDEVVVGSYSCEATLLSEEGPVTDWDLHVTVDGWEEFRPGAFPDPVPVAPEGLVRGVDQARVPGSGCAFRAPSCRARVSTSSGTR